MMICKARLLMAERRRKGSGETYMAVVKKASAQEFARLAEEVNSTKSLLRTQETERYLRDYGWVEQTSEIEICQGTIKVKIELTEEPYYGGSFPTLDFEYKCDSCGMCHWPPTLGLPNNTEELQALVQKEMDRDE